MSYEKLIKNLKKNFVKKAVVLSLAGVLLCSQSLTTTAATITANESQKPVHTCAFSAVDWTLVSSAKMDTHSYTSGYMVDEYGKTKPVLSPCDKYAYVYRAQWKCGCGKTNGYTTKTITVHSSCGQ